MGQGKARLEDMINQRSKLVQIMKSFCPQIKFNEETVIGSASDIIMFLAGKLDCVRDEVVEMEKDKERIKKGEMLETYLKELRSYSTVKFVDVKNLREEIKK